MFPYNGNGLEALDCLGDAYRFVGFVDDTPEKQGADSRGYPVMGRSALVEWADAKVLAVPGGPKSYQLRKHVIDGLGLAPRRFATIVHPTARISPLARIGHNVLIMVGVVVTSNAVIGNHVWLLPNTVIHHDAVLGD